MSPDRDAASVRVGTTREERAELREAMAKLHRVKLRLAALSGHYLPGTAVTEARLLDEALALIGAVVSPGTERRGDG